jgi:multiple antibiotic resistance protein
VGSRLPQWVACLSILVALALSCLFLLIAKLLFDFVKQRNEAIIERYMEICGRVSAILIGTIAVDMIMRGIDLWLQEG